MSSVSGAQYDEAGLPLPPAGAEFTATPNTAAPDKINTGINVIGKGAHIPGGLQFGRNVVVSAYTTEEAFARFNGLVPSGASV